LPIGELDAICYQYHAPASQAGRTFVFFNAIAGDLSAWEGQIAPALREAGHGTLSWNMRGQADSPAAPDIELDTDLIIADTGRLLAAVQPSHPVFVGLSVGGLYAARYWLQSAGAEGLVLINMLRRPGARIQWLNEALVRALEVGGLQLLKDLYGFGLFNEAFLAEQRANFFPDAPYQPMPPDHGIYRLLSAARGADWDLPYQDLTLPVLVVTGREDRLFLDLDDVDQLYRRLPLAQRVDLNDAAHMIPVERPEVLTRHLLKFAGELP
jgi:pimeloyl-ACP methyl ester carboxylesterase